MNNREEKTVLFLCSGNYYRSRFAEIWFNHHAQEQKLPWRAVSRALSEKTGPWKVGPISKYALAGLVHRNIPVSLPHREPLYCKQGDLHQADRIIALKESEHRPMAEALFPAELCQRIEYWHIHDIDVAEPESALAELEQLLSDLIRTLPGSNNS